VIQAHASEKKLALFDRKGEDCAWAVLDVFDDFIAVVVDVVSVATTDLLEAIFFALGIEVRGGEPVLAKSEIGSKFLLRNRALLKALESCAAAFVIAFEFDGALLLDWRRTRILGIRGGYCDRDSGDEQEKCREYGGRLLHHSQSLIRASVFRISF